MRNFHHRIRMCVYKLRRIINSGFLSYSFPYCPYESILEFSLFFFLNFWWLAIFSFWGRRISYNALCFYEKNKRNKTKNVFWRESKFRSEPIPRDKVSNKKYFFLVMGKFPYLIASVVWYPPVPSLNNVSQKEPHFYNADIFFFFFSRMGAPSKNPIDYNGRVALLLYSLYNMENGSGISTEKELLFIKDRWMWFWDKLSLPAVIHNLRHRWNTSEKKKIKRRRFRFSQ